MKKILFCGLVILFLVSLHVSGGVSFAADYPNRPITLVVNYGPGGGTDLSARVIAKKMESILGQPIVVENVGGGEGSVGLSRLLTADPDGYTIGTGTGSNLTVLPNTMPTPYKPFEDFTWLGSYAEWNYVLWIHKRANLNSFDEFLQYVRDNPGKVNYTGSGLFQVLLAEQIPMALGEKLDWSYIPNNSAADALMTALRGDADVFPGSLQDLKGSTDDFVPLVGFSKNASLPDLKTIDELGLTENPIRNWVGLLAPKGLPDDIRVTLENAIKQSLEDPEVIKMLENLFDPAFQSGAEFRENCIGISKVVAELIASGIEY